MRRYIGDGVYASVENGMIKLVTGTYNQTVIYLEELVYQQLVLFHDDVCKKTQEEADATD